MGIVVVGGQARKVGKTGVVAGIIAALPQRRWIAVKITQCHHDAEECHCDLHGQTFAMSEESRLDGATDSSRYLTAGASRSFWLRTRKDELIQALPLLRELMANSDDVIIESNSILEFIKPEVFVCVVDPAREDMKPAWHRMLEFADAVVLPASATGHVAKVPVFRMSGESFCGPQLAAFIEGKLHR